MCTHTSLSFIGSDVLSVTAHAQTAVSTHEVILHRKVNCTPNKTLTVPTRTQTQSSESQTPRGFTLKHPHPTQTLRKTPPRPRRPITVMTVSALGGSLRNYDFIDLTI